MSFSLNSIYVGHPISSDNGLMYQKLLLKSGFYYPLHVTMGVGYSCLKHNLIFCYTNMKTTLWKLMAAKNHVFDNFLLGEELDKDAVCFFGKLY